MPVGEQLGTVAKKSEPTELKMDVPFARREGGDPPDFREQVVREQLPGGWRGLSACGSPREAGGRSKLLRHN